MSPSIRKVSDPEKALPYSGSIQGIPVMGMRHAGVLGCNGRGTLSSLTSENPQ